MLFKLSTIGSFATLALAGVTVYEYHGCEDTGSSKLTVVSPTKGPSLNLLSSAPTPSSSSFSFHSSTPIKLSALSTTPIKLSSSAYTTLSIASPAATLSDFVKGDGTWYGGDCGEEDCWQGGACSFVDYVLPASIAGSTCVSEMVWNNSYNCGGCVEITYQGKKKIAMITNLTGGDAVHLDMSPNMFSQLADKSLGEIGVEWAHIPCPITTPLKIVMHGGASQYWFAATVSNASLRTAKMEVSTDSGITWRATVRKSVNFFNLASGGTGTKTAWIRVTSETGSQVTVEDVSMTGLTVTTATSNYA